MNLFWAVVVGVTLTLTWYQIHVFDRRWRCARYCWHIMSDYAGDRTRVDGELSDDWRAVSYEQAQLLRRNGVPLMTAADLSAYERRLARRNMAKLTRQHGAAKPS
jgi:hypothetical protein